MRKRQKFVVSAVLICSGLLGIQFTTVEWRYALTGLLALGTWMLSAWALKEGLSGIEWLTVLLPQTLFTAGAGLFYILLPSHWAAKLTVITLFGIGQYAMLLTSNIFSVAAIRTIALFRAALAVGFVMTLLTGFLLYNSILSFRESFWVNGIGVMVVSWFLALPALWAVNLEDGLSRKIISHTAWTGMLLGLLAAVISLWPMTLAVASLFLTTMLYVYLGIVQHHFMDRLSKKTALEYLTVGVVVLVTVLLTAK